VLELSYHGNAHLPRNIFVYAPQQRTLMVIDVIFPGWMPWRRFAVAQDVPGYFEQVKTINSWDFDTPRRRPCCAHRYACRRRNAVGVH
jgi:hypothetical protein